MSDRFNEDARRNAVARARELIEDDGYSQTRACQAVADDLGLKSPRTIAIWAVDLEQPLPSGIDARAKAVKAMQANLIYNQIARIELSDAAFRKAAELLVGITEAGDLWKWTTAYTNLVENRRLEEGKANTRIGVEMQQTNEPRSLSELASGQIERPPALPPNISPLARREG